MKLQIASDLHLEMSADGLPSPDDFVAVPDRDLLVLAGDIHTGVGARTFIERQMTISPVVYVPGNHEYYRRMTHEEVDEAWTDLARASGGRLHYLNPGVASVGGLRLFGAAGFSDLGGEEGRDRRHLIGRAINDFHRPHHDEGRWTVARHVATCLEQREALRAVAGAVDVVVTHWPPSRVALAPEYRTGNPVHEALNPYFINDEDALVKEVGARVWISGHTHTPHRGRVGATLSVGNPAGYPHEARHPDFEPGCVIEVTPTDG